MTHAIENQPEQLCVVSLNLAKQADARKVREDLESGPCDSVDVYLLQEVANEKDKPSVAEQLGEQLGYASAFSAAAPGVYDQGLAILSRFPLAESEVIRLKSYDLKFRSRQRFALSTVVHAVGREVYVWNVHLDTRINPDERLEQLDPVLRGAVRTNGPGLIGGDLNTNRFHWLLNVLPYPGGHSQATALRKAMRKIGFETPFPDETPTFSFLRQHLDWLFARNLKAVESGTFPTRYSDHYGIWATFQTAE